MDLSRNRLGDYKDNWSYACGELLIDSITREGGGSLLHLDISYNSFNTEESLKIAKKLNNNQSLLGLHFEGNSNFIIDSNGFMK